MMVLITYDLKQKDGDYSALYDTIKSLGDGWWHYFESVWIIHTDVSVEQCCTRLREHLDNQDFLLVLDITNDTRQGWLPSKAWDWIKANDR